MQIDLTTVDVRSFGELVGWGPIRTQPGTQAVK